MKILVSGATGFIGKHLTARLLSEGHTVHVVTRPSSSTTALPASVTVHAFTGDVPALITTMGEEKFDGIIHLASLYLAGHKSEDVAGLVESNVLFGSQLLEAAAKSNIPWFINTGTFWQHYQNKAYAPVNLYAATKQAFEDIARYYVETTPLNFVTLQLSDTFGPDDPRPKVFNLWLKASTGTETLNMSGGKQLISMNYIDNVTDAYLRLITLLSKDKKRTLQGKVFALNAKERLPLKKLAALFEKVTGTTLPIAWGALPYRPREVMRPWNKGKNVPGWKPRVSLADGIKKTYER